MPNADPFQLFHLGRWRVDCAAGQMTDGNDQRHLEPRLVRILQLLAAAQGQVLSRQELFDGVWPNQEITDQTLDSNISRLRQRLGDDPKAPLFILTVPKRGYRLLLAAEPVSAQSASDRSAVELGVGSAAPNGGANAVSAQRAWGSWLAVALLSLLTAAMFFWFGAADKDTSPVPTKVALDRAAPTAIAVLPFVNMSDDPDTGHFSDGIAEELLSQLTRVGGLRVASRTSSFRFRAGADDPQPDIREIAEQLNVRYVIEGSVRRDGEDLRITAQLIDASTGFHLWSHTYAQRWADVLEVQESITKAVVEKVQPQLASADRGWNPPLGVGIESAQAYELYLLGRHYWHQRQPQSLRQASEYFQSALELEPRFALAYAGLAECYLAMVPYASMSRAEAVRLAEPLLAKALTLAPSLAELRLALGHLHLLKTEWNHAETELRKSLALNPNLASAHMFLGNVYNDTGRLDMAYASYRDALRLDPLHATVLMNISQVALKLGLYQRSRQYLMRAQQLFPTHRYLIGLEAHLTISAGDEAAARRLLERGWPNGKREGSAKGPLDPLACAMLQTYLRDHGAANACAEDDFASLLSAQNAPLVRLMTMNHLAKIQSGLGNDEVAAELARQALSIGAEVDVSGGEDPFVHYELAVAHTLLNQPAAAIAAFQRSLSYGGRDLGWVRHDRRLEALLAEAEFQSIVQAMSDRQASLRQQVQTALAEG